MRSPRHLTGRQSMRAVLAVLALGTLVLLWCTHASEAGAQPAPTVTLQEWLIARNHPPRTEWVDGRVVGWRILRSRWDPDATTFWDRYGIPPDSAVSYTGDAAGAHGKRVQQALSYFDALGIRPSGPPPWNPAGGYSLDVYDLSLVSGASVAVIVAGGGVPNRPVFEPAPTPTPRPTATPAPKPAPTATPPPAPTPLDEAAACVLAAVTPEVVTAAREVTTWGQGARLSAKRRAQLRTLAAFYDRATACACEVLPPLDPDRSTGQIESRLCPGRVAP